MASQLPEGEPVAVDGSLPEQVLVGAEDRTFHAYLHIPFCRVRCGYCDFNTYTATELDGVSQASFAGVMQREIEFSADAIARAGLPVRKLSSVFFGGGTPTQLPASDLVALLDSLRSKFGLVEGAEVTTEANPDNLDEDYLAELKAGGFTRVSVGMQSAVASVLKVLDRTHDPLKVPSVAAAVKAAGLSVSVDLIYGAPGESVDDWRESLSAAISMQPDHISAYSLIVEEGTKLARQISRGELHSPDEDEQATKYELADEMLSAAGFSWYEVSNWSKSPETRSRHNLAYWRSNDWWGYGPGAHSHIGGVRWWNVKHPAPYSAALAGGVSPGAGRELLSDATRLEERILLEIRIKPGLQVSVARELPSFKPEIIAGFIANGLVEPAAAFAGQLELTLKGRLLADSLVRDLLG